MVPENIHTPPPPRKGSDFPGGRGGVNLPNFPVGRGGHHREIFPEGSLDARESNTEKTHKFTTTIYLRRYKTRRKIKSY